MQQIYGNYGRIQPPISSAGILNITGPGVQSPECSTLLMHAAHIMHCTCVLLLNTLTGHSPAISPCRQLRLDLWLMHQSYSSLSGSSSTSSSGEHCSGWKVKNKSKKLLAASCVLASELKSVAQQTGQVHTLCAK